MDSLTFKKSNDLSRQLYQYLSIRDYERIKEIVDKLDLSVVLNLKNNGLVSNILNYYIETDNEYSINVFIDIIDSKKIKLMKRDYLNLIKYYFVKDHDKAESIFDTYILSRDIENTECLLQPKDIDFILESNMVSLLKKTHGLFVSTTNNTYTKILHDPLLEIINCNYVVIEMVLKEIEKLIGITNINSLQTKLSSKKYNSLIDGGNVLHSRQGIITSESYSDLVSVYNLSKTKLGKSLLILHKRHLKNNPELKKMLDLNNIDYYLTPYHKNDDLFIIWYFLKLETKPYIITNDKFRDHIFTFETSKHIKHLVTQFKDIIRQQSVGYCTLTSRLNDVCKYSRCIQYISDISTLYIPHVNNYFIKITNV